MGRRAPRVFGTTEDCIRKTEDALGRALPQSFRAWLLSHNGKGLKGVTVFPVVDERDPQTTLESIEGQYKEGWSTWLENFEEEDLSFDHLLPFAEFGTGDYYCFDYGREGPSGGTCLAVATRPGASALSIQNLAGHESLETTMKYMHLSREAADEAIDQLVQGRAVKALQKKPNSAVG